MADLEEEPVQRYEKCRKCGKIYETYPGDDGICKKCHMQKREDQLVEPRPAEKEKQY